MTSPAGHITNTTLEAWRCGWQLCTDRTMTCVVCGSIAEWFDAMGFVYCATHKDGAA